MQSSFPLLLVSVHLSLITLTLNEIRKELELSNQLKKN